MQGKHTFNNQLVNQITIRGVLLWAYGFITNGNNCSERSSDKISELKKKKKHSANYDLYFPRKISINISGSPFRNGDSAGVDNMFMFKSK